MVPFDLPPEARIKAATSLEASAAEVAAWSLRLEDSGTLRRLTDAERFGITTSNATITGGIGSTVGISVVGIPKPTDFTLGERLSVVAVSRAKQLCIVLADHDAAKARPGVVGAFARWAGHMN